MDSAGDVARMTALTCLFGVPVCLRAGGNGAGRGNRTLKQH
jgi:hypothetical protein